jgi:hypothetical protein
MFFNIRTTFAKFEVDLLQMRTREGVVLASGQPQRDVAAAWTGTGSVVDELINDRRAEARAESAG